MATANAKSAFASDAVLNHIFRKAAYVQPTSLNVALFDATSSEASLDAGTLTGELTGNGYARVTISTEFGNVATAGSITNSAEIAFPQATGAWNQVVRTAILDQLDNVLYYGTLDTPVDVGAGDTFKFNASNWTATET